jgi:membrane associated rhomboid family serine protease
VIPLSDDENRRRRFPVINLSLILINLYVYFFVELAQPSERALETLVRSAGVIPLEILTGRDLPPGAPFGLVQLTLITSMFLHGGLLHLCSNMLYLWVFGDNVEDAMGHLNYLLFYLVTGVLASASHVALNMQSGIPSIGASGAIAGVLAGYLALFPTARIRTLLILPPFILLPRVSALVLIGLWFVMQLIAGLTSLGVAEESSGVAVWAHVGGFVAGYLLVRLFVPRPPARLAGFPE